MQKMGDNQLHIQLGNNIPVYEDTGSTATRQSAGSALPQRYEGGTRGQRRHTLQELLLDQMSRMATARGILRGEQQDEGPNEWTGRSESDLIRTIRTCEEAVRYLLEAITPSAYYDTNVSEWTVPGIGLSPGSVRSERDSAQPDPLEWHEEEGATTPGVKGQWPPSSPSPGGADWPPPRDMDLSGDDTPHRMGPEGSPQSSIGKSVEGGSDMVTYQGPTQDADRADANGEAHLLPFPTPEEFMALEKQKTGCTTGAYTNAGFKGMIEIMKPGHPGQVIYSQQCSCYLTIKDATLVACRGDQQCSRRLEHLECPQWCRDRCDNQPFLKEEWAGGPYLAIKDASAKAHPAVYAGHTVQANCRIGCYGGRLLEESQVEFHRTAQRKRGRVFIVKLFHRPVATGAIYINGEDKDQGSNILRFLRHSCAPNTRFETLWTGPVRRLVVVTTECVLQNEEFTINYKDYMEEEDYQCKCGEIGCEAPSLASATPVPLLLQGDPSMERPRAKRPRLGDFSRTQTRMEGQITPEELLLSERGKRNPATGAYTNGGFTGILQLMTPYHPGLLTRCDCANMAATKGRATWCCDGECDWRADYMECPVTCGGGCENSHYATETWEGETYLASRVPILDGTMGSEPLHHERGVYTATGIPRKGRIGCYGGQIINEDQASGRVADQRPSGRFYVMKLFHDSGPRGSTYIDGSASPEGLNILREMRHSCDPNTTFDCIWTGPIARLMVVANRDIPPGTELTVDYYDLLRKENICCTCGTNECRDARRDTTLLHDAIQSLQGYGE